MNKTASQTKASARSAVERLLKFRPRSIKEIRDRLKQKQFSSNIIDQTVAYYADLQLLDDKSFAKQWIRSRLNKPYGFRRIRSELRLKGIDEDILAKELAEAEEEHDEFESAKRIAQHRIEFYGPIEPRKLQQRLYGFLIRRGYSAQMSRTIMFQLTKKTSENDG